MSVYDQNGQLLSNVRDRRDRKWWWADNVFIDDYAPIIGPHAALVYALICRRAYNSTQKCILSGGSIAERLKIGRSTVTNALYTLEIHGLIDVEERFDADKRAQLDSEYVLLPVENWNLEPTKERIEWAKKRREEAAEKRSGNKKDIKRPKRGDTPEITDARRGIPSENIPLQMEFEAEGYSATDETLSHQTVDPLVFDGRPLPSGNNTIRQQDVTQDEKQHATTDAPDENVIEGEVVNDDDVASHFENQLALAQVDDAATLAERETESLVAALVENQLRPENLARQLIAKFGVDACRNQILWLDDNKPKKRGAALRTAIEQNWPPPPAWIERQEAQEAAARNRERSVAAAAAARDKEIAAEQEAARLEAENAQLDKIWESLDERTRGRIDAEVKKSLGFLYNAGLKAGGATGAMRRNLLRDYLAQLRGAQATGTDGQR